LTGWSQKRRVMRKYDLTAGMYDMRYAEEQEAKYRIALYNVTIKGSVLDVGCGSGLFFGHVASQAEKLVGVDVSGQLLLQARERARNWGNAHLVQADGDHLPFKDGVFDFVFAFTVLQNMPAPMETLKEIRRIARRNALMAVTALKKVFSLDDFRAMLQHRGLRVKAIKDDDSSKCYVALTVQG
jgi:ubiquinone/menaquinone biosynthesis C-methylase UbiE